MAKWEFGFALPNLKMHGTFETERVAVVGSNDDRVLRLREESSQVDAIMGSFTCSFGKPYEPASILMLLPDQKTSMMEEMLNVRNILAVASLFKAWSERLRTSHGAGTRYYLFSDYFDFCPIVPGPNEMLMATSPFLKGVDEGTSFKGQCSPILVYPASYVCEWDTDIANLLLGLENLRASNKVSEEMESIFRSLQIAFQAARSPFENRMTIYDYGTRVVLWISALEVLLHAGVPRISRKQVTQFVKECPWLCEHLVENDIPASICNRLYDLRNDFAHGNMISPESGLAFPDLDGSPYLVFVAPLIYWMALREKVLYLWPELRSEDSDSSCGWFGDPCIETLIEISGGDNDE